MSVAYVTLRNELGTALDGFSASGFEIFSPGEDWAYPSPSTDPNAPAGVVAWDVEDGPGEQTDFAGGFEVAGDVVSWIWLQIGVTDLNLRVAADDIVTLLRTARKAGLWFGEGSLGRPVYGSEADGSSGWYGRPLRVPYRYWYDADTVTAPWATSDGTVIRTSDGVEITLVNP